MMEYASYLNFSCKNRDFGYGFLMFGCCTGLGNLLLLFLLFILGLKILHLGFHHKGPIRFLDEFRGNFCYPKSGFSLGIDVCGICYSKILSCKGCLCELLKNLSPSSLENSAGNKDLVNVISNYDDDDDDDDDDEGKERDCEVDEEMDNKKLRKAIKIERDRSNAAYLELEKERIAAASAINEAMAMILRLQNEKSSIEMNAHQYRRLAEQKQLYDQEVIRSLRWILSKYESERSILERELNLCRQRQRRCLKDEEGNQVEGFDQTSNQFCSPIEDDFNDGLISSLDMDSPLV